MWCFYETWCFTGQDQEEQLYLENCTMYKHRIFTTAFLRTFPSPWILHHSPRKLLEVSTLKIWRNPLSDWRWRDLVDIQRHLSVPKAATTTRIGGVEAQSWSFLKVPITCQELPQRSNMERSPKIHAIVRFLILSDIKFGNYSSKKQAFRNTKIGTWSVKGLYYWWKSPPTSGHLYVQCKRVRLYLSSEYTSFNLHFLSITCFLMLQLSTIIND